MLGGASPRAGLARCAFSNSRLPYCLAWATADRHLALAAKICTQDFGCGVLAFEDVKSIREKALFHGTIRTEVLSQSAVVFNSRSKHFAPGPG